MFGKKPPLFSAQSNNFNNIKNKEYTAKYLNWCKLEILPSVFYDHIGDTIFDTAISVQDVFGNILQLNQHWIKNGKYTTKSPNSFFCLLDFHQAFHKIHQPGPSPYVMFYLQH